MKKIAIVADSNSGYTQEEARAAGIFLVPMPFYINEEEYFEGVNLTQEQFFEYLKMMQMSIHHSHLQPVCWNCGKNC